MMSKIMAFYWIGILLLVMEACQSSVVGYDAGSIDVPTNNQKVTEGFVELSRFVNSSPYQNGDIIFHSSLSEQSMAIQLVTKSPYSHVGLLYEEEGKWYVYEAISRVKATPLEQWIARGKDKHYVVKRLKDKSLLTNQDLQKMKIVGKQYKGKYYDLKFEWSDDKMYCSELVWKMYDQALGIELGKLQQIKDFNVDNPLVQDKIKERFGSALPLEQWVISPARIFECSHLETVFESPK